MKVKPKYLLLLASLAWLIAGYNVVRLGVLAYLASTAYHTIFHYLGSVLVFTVFQIFIFGRLVKKHTKRIQAYQDEKQYFWKFFDCKSYIIMVIMMTGGISLRAFKLVPEALIAVFYTGLGASLFLAGVLFGKEFIRSSLCTHKP